MVILGWEQAGHQQMVLVVKEDPQEVRELLIVDLVVVAVIILLVLVMLVVLVLLLLDTLLNK